QRAGQHPGAQRYQRRSADRRNRDGAMSQIAALGANGYGQSMIAVEGLRKRYGQIRALDGLSMSVAAGSIYGFVGPNGAGKTTTRRILAPLLQGDGGTGGIAGEDVRLHPARVRAKLGFMPDFFGVYEDLSVYEYLDFYARSYAVPARKRKTTIDELLELIDLP